MGLDLSKNLAATMLTLTSAHCMTSSFHNRTARYARAAYRIYFLTGLLALAKAWWSPSDFIETSFNTAFVWSYCLGLPLIAADVSRNNVLIPDLVALHVFIPTTTLIAYHSSSSDVQPFLLAVSHLYSLSSIALTGIYSISASPLATAFTYYFAHFRVNPEAPEPGFIEMSCFMAAVTNLFSLHALSDY